MRGWEMLMITRGYGWDKNLIKNMFSIGGSL